MDKNGFFLRFYLFSLDRGGREGEREGEKHQCLVASHMPPTEDLTWPITRAWALTGNLTLWSTGQHSIH